MTGKAGHSTTPKMEKLTSAPADHQGGFAPQVVGQVAHRQSRQQRRQAAGGDQIAQQGFVISEAEDVEIEQQPVYPHGCPGDSYIGQEKPGVRTECPDALSVGSCCIAERDESVQKSLHSLHFPMSYRSSGNFQAHRTCPGSPPGGQHTASPHRPPRVTWTNPAMRRAVRW